ncbi:hypothetical protein NYE40_06720 [Paenibacillus sp. FSL W8-1187]|uniref:hypothetical protein n=1 Tax=unclassified Paenibacillus TaxID=185978 RepID=UPI00129A0C97|nr:hypothetical protein [Paenibacillus sp. B01]QGG55290.1 hypothetical protein GE073_06640 [Paenibacillus sp. B01]
MYLYQAKVGHHRIRFEVQTEHLKEWIAARFPEDRDELAALPVGSGEAAVEAAAGEASESEVVAALASTEAAGAKAVLYITDFYGSMYDEGPVEIEADGDTVVYSRKDYRMETSADYSSVKLQVFDDLALKHALINWYSAWLIHRREGLLVHSSCVVDGGKAWMFVGHSGAGKSTAAELSAPRPILSDEATLLLLDADGGVTIHDSPLRSENEERGEADASPLGGVHFLVQAEEVRREPVGKVEALIGLMDKVFYWKHSKPETAKMIAVCREVVQRVPAYELHFQKNDSFWEVIS